MKPLQFIGHLFRFHKLKFFAVIVFALIFTVLLFPYDDLGDLATTKIAEATGGSLFIQFEKMGLSFIPSPGVQLENVVIESSQLPPVNATNVEVSPWLLGALSARTGAVVNAEGVFNGKLTIDYREGDKLKSGVRAQNIDLQAGQIALPALTDFLRNGNLFSMDLQGVLDLKSALNVDPGFEQQPTGTVGIQIAGLALPAQNLTIQQLGQVPFPSMKFSKMTLQGKLAEGRLEIEDLTLGGPRDEISGKIKGELGLTFRRGPAGVQPVVGASDLRIDLTASNALLRANESTSLGLVFKFFDACKKPAAENTRYIFRMKGNSPIPECLTSI